MQLLLYNSALKLVSLTKSRLSRGPCILMPQHFWYQQRRMGSVLREHVFSGFGPRQVLDAQWHWFLKAVSLASSGSTEGHIAKTPEFVRCSWLGP